MSEYAKNIQTIEDMWKKRIELRMGRTDGIMTELLPCPFCGGEAEMLTAESMNGGYLFGIMCNDCRSRGDVYDTEAEAIAAWNTRADFNGYEQAAIEAWSSVKAYQERTCHVKELDALTQTLSMVNGCSWGECSECGCLTPTDSVFCIECGAKVVGE